jgi:AcrR family transcriptional regulator
MATAADPENRRETKGERTRRLLLEEAIARFGARGYRATSVSEVARSIGLTQAAAYAYFDSKEALFDAAVDSDANALLDQAISLAETTPAQQLIPMLLVGLIGGLEQHPLVRRVLGGHEPDTVPRLINLPSLARFTDLIATRVEEGQQTGEVRTDLDARMFASGAEALLLGLLMSVTQVGQTSEPRRQMGVVHLFDRVLRVDTQG